MNPNQPFPKELFEALNPERMVYLHTGTRSVTEYTKALSRELIGIVRTALNREDEDLQEDDFADVPLIWDLLEQLSYNEVLAEEAEGDGEGAG